MSDISTTSILNQEINGYKFVAFLNSGSFGSVYKVTKGNVDLAIKIFREDYVLKEYREKGEAPRIKREIEIMRSVNHPRLIKYYEDFVADILGVQHIFLVMEYAPGKDLQKILEAGSLSQQRAIEIFQKVLDGVGALHSVRGDSEEVGIIHRDLKPANIMVSDSDEIKILDFGLSKVIDFSSITSTGDFLGSPLYASPEQIVDSKHIDKRSDLYSLGVIFYQMLTGKLPYTYANIHELYENIKHNRPVPPRQYLPAISNSLENIILRLLSKLPYERNNNSAAVLSELSQNGTQSIQKHYDLKPKFVLRLWNEKSALETFIKDTDRVIHVEFPVNHKDLQKGLLSIISTKQFVRFIDPATIRLAYASQQEVKGLQALPYAPANFQVITPDYLGTPAKQQEYVKSVIDTEVNLGADILLSPFHYTHNTNVAPTQRRNPVAEWFDLDVKLLKESVDYRNSQYPQKELFGGICLKADSLTDERYKTDILNIFSSIDCDGYFVYVDCIDNSTNSTVLFHYITTLVKLQKATRKPVIAGRVNSVGLGLICAGIAGFSMGTARFETFYEDLYKAETDTYVMYERYYIPQLLGSISIEKKSPTKLQEIFNVIGACDCKYCAGKSYVEVIAAPNNKLHFLQAIHAEIDAIAALPESDRQKYFLTRIDSALEAYKALGSVFKSSAYAHLTAWKNVFETIAKQ